MGNAVEQIITKLDLAPYTQIQVRLIAVFRTEELFEFRNDTELLECIIANDPNVEILDVGLTDSIP